MIGLRVMHDWRGTTGDPKLRRRLVDFGRSEQTRILLDSVRGLGVPPIVFRSTTPIVVGLVKSKKYINLIIMHSIDF